MLYTPNSINKIPEHTGIYKFLDKDKKILYIGKANDLKKRTSSYFRDKNLWGKTRLLVEKIKFIEVILVENEFDALLLEAKLINKLAPKYNISMKNGKSYVFISITKEEFPRIELTRRNQLKNSISFGPFLSKRIVKEVLFYLRNVFPYCTQNPRIKKSCFYTHINLCNPCPAGIKTLPKEKYKVVRQKYLGNIANIKRILKGEGSMVITNLNRDMLKFSKNLQFEEAAKIRNKLNKLESLYKWRDLSLRYIEDPQLLEDKYKKEAEELIYILKNDFNNIIKLERIECYDVSNISGKLATGAMITFVNGRPAKKYYRRFKIKAKMKRDDFSFLKEVFRRRFNHKDWTAPDLIVVDGGKPQLSAVKKVLHEMEINLPFIGLAKKKEEIVIPGINEIYKIKLERHSPALHLVQRLRDEAHRFAHKYHQLLRVKHLINEVENKYIVC